MEDSQSTTIGHDEDRLLKLDMRGLPPIYVLSAHLSINEQHEVEDILKKEEASLTYDINEASIVLGNISKPRRAKSELQWKGVQLEDTEDTEECASPRIDLGSCADKVKVINLDWLKGSLNAGEILPLQPYTLYTGRLVASKAPTTKRPAPMKTNGVKPSMSNKSINIKEGISHGIVKKLNANPIPAINRYKNRDRIQHGANKGKIFSSSAQAASQKSNQYITRPTGLLHQTTSEHDEAASSALPPMPHWVRENKIYACERATPLVSPNQAFICQLKKIKLARVLTLDEIGVRAYSSSIASLAAYPYLIESAREILALPSCDQKIAHLFHEYQTNNGKIQAVVELEADPVLKVLREFYEIWGVGAKTAREFYFDKGWRDLDDIIEHGWKSLSRVQQIGLKYYDEFMLKIPRAEVESIAAIVTKHACLVTDGGIESIIVGGYRRGKSER